ncbi:hypothetical protein M231_06270 [Tremella mesenterica]|uniref:Uncharacterized protein n=1 Tax=Tremella mesenterica TaxID=5217 RepID=A0A4Q1BE68_TREME|nr:uncharacterized protein TREMEDRAFT_65050 [Tremella mesenterica DSM 1558]EIW66667.1 hypothetical protein TREMEDRAFT_65050 [Tremella mesenterica DSM 1558]RXK36486.1 hypothetical protein M231_06270 [Tremella mesenterica]
MSADEMMKQAIALSVIGASTLIILGYLRWTTSSPWSQDQTPLLQLFEGEDEKELYIRLHLETHQTDQAEQELPLVMVAPRTVNWEQPTPEERDRALVLYHTSLSELKSVLQDQVATEGKSRATEFDYKIRFSSPDERESILRTLDSDEDAINGLFSVIVARAVEEMLGSVTESLKAHSTSDPVHTQVEHPKNEHGSVGEAGQTNDD